MRTYGILGYPLTHSFSKKYFDDKFAANQLSDASFLQFSLPNIGQITHELLNTNGLEGFCITIPHKKEIIPYLHQATPEVLAMGACNCVRIRNGKLIGYNTDIIGFRKSFEPLLQPNHQKALVLGTGGAAAAVTYVLQQMNIPFYTVSRSPKGEGQLAYSQLNQAILQSHSIIINCTPLGTYPNVNDAPDLPYHLLTHDNYLYDLVYNPPLTRFLQLGTEQGALVKNGYDMLTIQAEENWKIWNA